MKRHSYATTVLALVVLALVGCAPVATNNSTTSLPEVNITIPLDGSATSTSTPAKPTPPTVQAEDFAATLTFTEGETIELSTFAVDPDEDEVTLEFSEPFNRRGTWRTEAGDAGDYPVTVTARDSRGASTTQRILVSIKPANRAPEFSGPASISVKEGDEVVIDLKAADPDGDELILSYSGWMKSDQYVTSYDDAGKHTVTVTAEDGMHTTKKDVTITVENVNRAPVVELDRASYTTTELERMRVRASAKDPDGDRVTVSFSSPLADDGSWTPALDTAGVHTATVTASDGITQTTEEVTIIVEAANRAPTIAFSSPDGIVHAKENDVVDLTKALSIEDPEGGDVRVTYAGWMTSATKKTSFDDAGTYVVKITASDEEGNDLEQDVTIIVEDVNRPPVFVKTA